MDFCNIAPKMIKLVKYHWKNYSTQKEGGRELTWFIMVESLDPSWIFFSRMFNSFTSLSEGIYNNREHYLDL